MRLDSTARGITLLELMVVVAIIGILGAISVVNLMDAMPGYRTRSAARRILMDLRAAPSIAARTNLPFTVTFDLNDPTCPATTGGTNLRPGYTGRTTNPFGVVTQYFKTCLSREFSGVGIQAVGPGGPLSCVGTEVTTSAPASGCTMCAAGAPVQLTFFPTGELNIPAAVSLTLVPERDLIPGPAVAFRALAIGITPVTGRARLYQPNNTGAAWECP